jgi:glycosyltransferase involved in cell wall biosynthesis
VIGMVGRLRAEKRHELAIEAMASLRASGSAATLCIVGDGPRRRELERLTSKLGLDAIVRFAGERPDAGRLVAAFDAGLLCSSFEGMPLAALETLVAGVPLVATAVGSLPELLAETPDRIVPANATADEIAAALARTLADGTQDAGAQERARARFGIARVARDLERVYDEVLRS